MRYDGIRRSRERDIDGIRRSRERDIVPLPLIREHLKSLASSIIIIRTNDIEWLPTHHQFPY